MYQTSNSRNDLVITTIRLGVYRNSLSSDSDSGTE